MMKGHLALSGTRHSSPFHFAKKKKESIPADPRRREKWWTGVLDFDVGVSIKVKSQGTYTQFGPHGTHDPRSRLLR